MLSDMDLSSNLKMTSKPVFIVSTSAVKPKMKYEWPQGTSIGKNTESKQC